MIAVRLQSLNDFDEWRGKARQLLAAGLSPENVAWRIPGEANGLFEGGDAMLPEAAGPIGSVPRQFIELAQTAINHADPARFDLLYRVLWRLQEVPQLLLNAADKDNSTLTLMASAVRRDSHKMKAFVRFKAITDDTGFERFAAWFEPEHYSLELTAPFFARRFDGMVWAIVTPYRSVYWDTQTLVFAEGGRRTDVPEVDAVEEDWRTYFSSIFNPARLKISAMKSEMPVKYWRNLPEAELIAPLVRGARQAEQQMIERAASQPPSRHVKQTEKYAQAAEAQSEITSLADARAAVQGCRRCPLYEHATQAVFGEGPEHAQVMFVGEQPGDQEDLAGQPFIGPAGKVLDAAVEKVGIDRSRVYVTNAVKHFKFEPRGKRRIHNKPDAGEIQACKFWLNLEIGFVKPKVIVALGATAAHSLLGRTATISKLRGAPITMEDGTVLFVTNHPSYLLRIPDPERKALEREKFEQDLVLVRDAIAALEACH
ncbi:UdgX family uracil-DNA binding protein [Devosia sp. RR2S18]|uniref:UdgX family uracil-DNA binding protein n=1 Tax=Devosia rhizosphaerae TaxID=3049774 RepID=UPI0025424A57|nr:UdgX family uracil-DNA binding protein [Devosia sp. RR2S18]WIJ26113.1 UdgX family uracil-DNA binding protein [Devosia sp. RR2S18]